MSKNNQTFKITAIVTSVVVMIIAFIGINEYKEFKSDYKSYIHSLHKLNESYILGNDIDLYSDDYTNVIEIEEKYQGRMFNSAFKKIQEDNAEFVGEIEKKRQEEIRNNNIVKNQRSEIENNRTEVERSEHERLEKERSEAARLEKERLERERKEKERIELENSEAARIEKERLEREREWSKKEEAKYASFNILTEPPGADIYLDGKKHGQSPMNISKVAIGKHILKIEKAGCPPLIKEINVVDNKIINISEKLSTGKEIVITTGIKCDSIYVDDVFIGISPITVFVTYGNHEISAKRNNLVVKERMTLNFNDTSKRIDLSFFDNNNKNIVVNNVTFTMIAVKGGSFKMGNISTSSKIDETPSHNVNLSDFYIGETEVTQELWESVMGYNPSRFKEANRPVERVSWDECQLFINKLNQITGEIFRLPTEAEWEYAARGGDRSNGHKFAGSSNIEHVAWYDDNSSNRTHIVKTKDPNELGIYDMSGNIAEWCQDWYGYYEEITQTNPTGPSNGLGRVIRGGSWNSYGEHCRVLYRYYHAPSNWHSNYGFRIVMLP